MHKNNFVNTYINKLHKFYKDKRLFSVIIILQIIVLSIMTFTGILMPANDLEMPLTSLNIYGNDKTVSEVSEEKIMLSRTEDGEDTWIGGGEYNLPFGAYKLEIEYQSEYGDFLNEAEYVASVGIYGTDRAEEVYRVSGFEKSAECLFWVDTIIKKAPVSFEIIYKNNNNMQINSVAVRENTAYRFVCIMAVACAFIIMDIFLGMFMGGNSREKFTVAFAVLAITFVSVIPLINGRMNVKHDILFHLNRIWEMSAAIKAGNVPVRMMTGLLGGYGYPISIFYCDILLYIPALLCCAGVTLQMAYKVYITFISAITVLSAYTGVNSIVKNKRISLMAAAVYTLCSYRLINIYMRGALGEYSAMAFFPIIVLGMYRIYTKDTLTYKEWMPLAAGMSGVIMCHIISTEMVVIFLVIFCLISFKKTFNIKRIVALLKAAATTTLICMWFVVPFMEYYITHDINVGEVFEKIHTDAIGFKNIMGIFMTTLKFKNGAAVSALPITFGFVLIIGIVAATYYMLSAKQWKCRDTVQFTASVKLMIISLIALCFTQRVFPWGYIQSAFGETVGRFIGTVQFPWRFLAIAAVTITFMMAIAIKEIKKFKPEAEKVISVCIIAAMIVITGSFYTDFSKNGSVWDNYFYSMPKEHTIQVGYSEYLIIGSAKEDSNYKLAQVNKGDVTIADMYKKDTCEYLVCTNNDNDISVVEIPVYNYKYHKASDTITGEIIETTNGSANRIALNIPAKYSGTIKVEFCTPVHWHIAETVSAVTVAAIIVWYVADSRRKGKKL